jgi:thiol-disulfide isomerase/thioredoxin
MRFYLILFLVTTGVFSLSAQENGPEITLEDGSKFLLGPIPKDMLQKEPYINWYKAQYEAYLPNEGAMQDLAPLFDGVRILIFLGTWCGDSMREVPRFIKILDLLGVPETQMELIAVDKRPDNFKTSPGDEHRKWAIRRVPTFILVKGGREIGRIVERPQLSLERDLCDLLQCSPGIPRR